MAEEQIYDLIITDFREDPGDDTAFGVIFDVHGPGNFVETVRVSFSEEFVRKYFKIHWHEDFAKIEHDLVKKHRGLFIQWALIKVEWWIDHGTREEEKKMVLEPDADMHWAKKIGSGEYGYASEPKPGEEGVYCYKVTG